jgi:uncharacterized protein Yka (UPF0111/DUF47 family)
MKTVEEYRQHADECRRLAERARTPEDRKALLSIATSWDKLAGDRDRKITKERTAAKPR